MTASTEIWMNLTPPHPGPVSLGISANSMLSVPIAGELSLSTIAGIGLVVVAAAWIAMILQADDVERGTDRFFAAMVGILVTLGAIGDVLIANLADLVGSAPGVVSSIIAGGLGYLALDGTVEISAGIFALIVAAVVVSAIAISNA